MLLCLVKGRFRRQGGQTSDEPLEVEGGFLSGHAMSCGNMVSGGPADRSQDSRRVDVRAYRGPGPPLDLALSAAGGGRPHGRRTASGHA